MHTLNLFSKLHLEKKNYNNNSQNNYDIQKHIQDISFIKIHILTLIVNYRILF